MKKFGGTGRAKQCCVNRRYGPEISVKCSYCLSSLYVCPKWNTILAQQAGLPDCWINRPNIVISGSLISLFPTKKIKGYYNNIWLIDSAIWQPWQHVGNLSSLTKTSRAETKLIAFTFKTKQKVSKKLFLLTIFCFPFNALQINGYFFKNRSWIPCFRMIFFVIEWLEEVNMATWTWE
jgi:hypothetical protein